MSSDTPRLLPIRYEAWLFDLIVRTSNTNNLNKIVFTIIANIAKFFIQLSVSTFVKFLKGFHLTNCASSEFYLAGRAVAYIEAVIIVIHSVSFLLVVLV